VSRVARQLEGLLESRGGRREVAGRERLLALAIAEIGGGRRVGVRPRGGEEQGGRDQARQWDTRGHIDRA